MKEILDDRSGGYPVGTSAKVRSTRHLSGFVFTTTHHEPSFQLPRHKHDLASLVLVLDGVYHEKTSQFELAHLPGAILYKPPREPHSNEKTDHDARCLLVEFIPERFRWLRKKADWLDTPHQFHDTALRQFGTSLLGQLESRQNPNPLSIEAAALSLLAASTQVFESKQSGTRPLWLEVVDQHLNSSFSYPVRMDDIAKIAGVHQSHLSRVFRTWYGCSVSEYIHQLRIKKAAEMLRNSSLPLTEIAVKSGFSDQSHLGRVFKKILRTTPAQFRQAARQ